MKKKLNILMLEDVATDAELIEHELRKEKIVFVSKRVEKKNDFLRELKDSAPDIIISDYKLPQFDGLAALELVKKHAPLVPFIMCTGSLTEETAADCIKTGAADYVIKEHLVRIGPAVKGALEKKRVREEKERAEEALRISAREWQITFNAIGDGLCLLDLDGKIGRCNKVMTKLLNKPFKDILGHECCTLLHGTLKPIEDCPFIRMCKSHKREAHVFQRGNGWYNCSVDPILDKAGNLIRAAIILSDITHLKKTEEELQEERNILRILIDNIPDYIYIKDCGSRFTLVNKATANIIGKETTEELIGKSDFEYYPHEIALKYYHEEQEIVENKKTIYNKEEMAIDESGSQRWSLTTKVPFVDNEGKVLGIVGIGRDITERKHADEALQKSEASLSRAQEIAHLGNWDWNIVTNELSWSDEIYRIFGFQPQEFEATYETFLNSIHPDDRNFVNKKTRAALDKKKPYSIDHRIVLPNGDVRIVHEQAEVMRDDSGKPIRMIGTVQDITEHKRAEEQIYNLAKFPSENPFPVLRAMKDGTILYVNEAGLPLLKDWGCEVGQFVPDRLRKLIRDVFKSRQRAITEIEHKDRIFSFVFTPIVEAGYVNLYGSDITDRKRVEKALRESEQKYRMLVDNQTDFVIKVDTDGYYLFVSPSYCEFVGKSEKELLGKKAIPLVHEEDREATVKAMKALYTPPFTCYVEQRVLAKEEWRWVGWATKSVLDENNKVIAFVSVGRDITERRIMDEELRKLSVAVEQGPASILITDPEGKIEYVNPKFAEMTGYTYKEVIGKNPRFLKSGEQGPEFYKILWDTIASGKVWRGEFLNKRKDGELYWENSIISPITDEQGQITHFIGIKEDITGHKRLEEQFRHTQKMEAIGRLAGGVAHDFNNMLTAILGFSDFMLLKLKKGDPLRGYVEEIKSAGNRAASIAHQLLVFSRKQILKLEIININSIVTDIEKMLMRLIGEDIECETLLDENLDNIKADRGQIEQIIMNLAINARDAMPSGGKLIIETANRKLDEGYCATHPEIRPGSYVMLVVNDTGCGIDKEIQERIFEPFFTTKEVGKGTGLGLSTVFGIVKQSEGSIYLYSEPGKGTTFKIYIPSVFEKSTVAKKETIPRDMQLLKGKETILLVDDDDSIRKVCTAALELYGYKVIEAINGEEAIKQFKSKWSSIDLLLTDVILPGMNGKELAEKVLSLKPNAAVLYISGYQDHILFKQGVFDGTVSFLEKPFAPKELALAVRNILDEYQNNFVKGQYGKKA